MFLRSAALALVGLLIARTAAADADDGVVLESYTGARPANAGRLLAPVLEELTTRGFTGGYDGVGRKYEAEVSRAARSPAGMPGNFATEVEVGHKAWIKGRFDDAVATLAPLVDAAHANAAAVSQDPKLRDLLQRALIDLALSQQRQGDPAAARAAMGELLRSFPKFAITRATHGPEAFTLYETTRKELAAGGRGELRVEVSDSATSVFVNEQYVKTGAVHQTDLLPGTYRVYATSGTREGRVYAVEVTAGAEARLAIDVAYDAALHIEPSWTGLEFATDAERAAHEGTYAARFAKLAHASAVAVVGIDTVKGQEALVGSLVSLDGGTELRGASIPTTPARSAARRDLARYLAGDDDAKASLDLDTGKLDHGTGSGAGTGAAGQPRRDGGGSRWGVLKYVTAGLGLAAAGVGTYLLIQDGTCSSDMTPCPKFYDNTVLGWSFAGGGAAVVGIAVLMFVTDDRSPERTVLVAPTRGGAMASVRFGF